MSTSWLIRLAAAAIAGTATENELFELPIQRWSYSIPALQFGVKPYSNPTPKEPPQRVELAEYKPTLPRVVLMKALLLVTAAPPFRYSNAAFQAYPIWPVK